MYYKRDGRPYIGFVMLKRPYSSTTPLTDFLEYDSADFIDRIFYYKASP